MIAEGSRWFPPPPSRAALRTHNERPFIPHLDRHASECWDSSGSAPGQTEVSRRLTCHSPDAARPAEGRWDQCGWMVPQPRRLHCFGAPGPLRVEGGGTDRERCDAGTARHADPAARITMPYKKMCARQRSRDEEQPALTQTSMCDKVTPDAFAQNRREARRSSLLRLVTRG